MSFLDRMLTALEPIILDSNDLATYVGGMSEGLFQDIEDLASDGANDEVGWSVVVDLSRIPDIGLDYLAQFVGVRLPNGLTADQKRSRIAATDGWKRGAVSAIAAAPLAYLTGTRTVTIRERDATVTPNDPAYGLTVITKTSETPPDDLPSTNALLNGGFETNTTNWQNAGIGTVISRDVTVSKFGAASLKVVTPGTVAGEGALNAGPANAGVAATSGQTWTASAWVKAPAGAQMDMLFRGMDVSNVETERTLITFTGTGDWQRVTATIVLASVSTVKLWLSAARTSGLPVQAITFWVDGVQVESGSIATPYIETDTAIASRPAGQGSVGAALTAQKPAGIILNYVVLAGQDYLALYNGGVTTYANIFSTYLTYQGVVNAAPGT